MIFLPVNLMILMTQTCVMHGACSSGLNIDQPTTIGGMIDSDRNPDHIPKRGVYSEQTITIVRANNEVSE